MKKQITGVSTLKLYDEVRIVAILNKRRVQFGLEDSLHPIKVGDRCTILEINYNPLEFKLECENATGGISWSGTFQFADLLVDKFD